MTDFRLKVFVSVARNLSFTKAAEEIFISQPAITKHIKELESTFQTPLFERFGNKISLTAAGKLLLEHSQHILEAYNRMDYEMSMLRNSGQGELRMGASTTIAQYVLPPLLAEFSEKFPHISISMLNDNSAGIENALQQHQIDLGMVEGQHKQVNLKYSKFMDDELVAVVHNRSKLAVHDEITVRQLQQIPLVLRENGSGTLEIIKTALSAHNLKLSDMCIRLQLGSTESIKRFLENADCMSILSIRSINRELAQGLFKIVEISDMDMPREFHFVQRQGEETGLPQQFIRFTELCSKDKLFR